MENDNEPLILNRLSYYSYSKPDFWHIPMVIFFKDHVYISAELKYQIVFHLLSSLFAFLLFSIGTPISFFSLICQLVQLKRDSQCDNLKEWILPLLVGVMTVFNVLFFIPSLPIVFGTIGLVSWILSGVFVVGLTIFNVITSRIEDLVYIGAYKNLSIQANGIWFIRAKDNNPYQQETSNIIEASIDRVPFWYNAAPKKEIWQKVPVSEISFRNKIFLRNNEITEWKP